MKIVGIVFFIFGIMFMACDSEQQYESDSTVSSNRYEINYGSPLHFTVSTKISNALDELSYQSLDLSNEEDLEDFEGILFGGELTEQESRHYRQLKINGDISSIKVVPVLGLANTGKKKGGFKCTAGGFAKMCVVRKNNCCIDFTGDEEHPLGHGPRVCQSCSHAGDSMSNPFDTGG